jgi:hypothetical protein
MPTIGIIRQIEHGTFVRATHNNDMTLLVEKIYELNRQLMSHSDMTTQNLLEKEWHDIEKATNEFNEYFKQRTNVFKAVGISLSIVI